MPDHSSRIFLNGRFLCRRFTGVQKYAYGIALALQARRSDCYMLAPKGKYDDHGLKIIRTGWGHGFFWEQVWLPLYILFHPDSLLINLCNSAPLLLRKQAVTIHDLAFKKNKEWFSPSFRNWYRFLIPRLCHRSKVVITVSDFIKREIIVQYSVPKEKICIVPNGLPEIQYDNECHFDFKYLFLTGFYNPRKNASFVLSHLHEIVRRGYHVVATGGRDSIFGPTHSAEEEWLHILDYVNERQYYTLMHHADALLYPSGYEGFGIPVLEALTLGTKVIVPDIEVYRESFGNCLLYYQVNNDESFLQSLEKVDEFEPPEEELNFIKKRFTFDEAEKALENIINGLT